MISISISLRFKVKLLGTFRRVHSFTHPPMVLVAAYDESIEPSTEGALRERALAVYPTTVDGATLDGWIGFVSASRTIPDAFGAPEIASTTTTTDATTTRAILAPCIARSNGWVMASGRVRGTVGTYVCARASEEEAPRGRASDRGMVAMLERVGSVGLDGLEAVNDVDIEAVREVWRRAVGMGGEALRPASTRRSAEEEEEEILGKKESSGNAVGDGNEKPPNQQHHGLENYDVFYGREKLDNADALEFLRAGERETLDDRTASTLAMLRRDLQRGANDVKSVYIKPAHNAWVCASATSRDERAYIVVEDSSDTLLRVVKSAKAFAEEHLKDAPDAFNVDAS